MDKRKWEDLEVDCLVNVLARVGMESLLFDIPFVCKSWYKATLNPLCWEHLVFPKETYLFEKRFMDRYGIKDFCGGALLKFLVFRSQGICTELDLRYLYFCCLDLTRYLIGWFPLLRRLCMPSNDWSRPRGVLCGDLVRKLKHLEDLILGDPIAFPYITEEINLHCKNFTSLTMCRSRQTILKMEATAIVTNLPKIRYLKLCCTSIDKECLVMILQGCKNLAHFEFSDCSDFELDDKILELASHIDVFKCEGGLASGIHWNWLDSLSEDHIE